MNCKRCNINILIIYIICIYYYQTTHTILLITPGMLAFLGACIIMLVVAVIVWRPKDAGIYPMKAWKPRYRHLGAPPKIPTYLQYKDHEK